MVLTDRDIVVRPGRSGDASFVRRVAAEAFAEYDGDATGARTLRMFTERRAHALVAECAETSVGFAIVTVERGVAHVGAIAVERAWRGRGIGWRLLRAVERRAAEMGARSVRLETGEANVAAIELFVRAGFVRERRVAVYYRTGYDALVYRKALVAGGV